MSGWDGKVCERVELGFAGLEVGSGVSKGLIKVDCLRGRENDINST